jgi:pimeloyl-ACP methyl ester carboxylesterase
VRDSTPPPRGAASADVDGCALSYVVEGEGPPVVLIQGVGVHGSGWTPQVRALRRRYLCITFDNRGMGLSQPAGTPITVPRMAADVLALMDHLGWSSAHLVGHSLGGPIALEVALREPRRVRSLSLLCTIARGRDATRMTPRMLRLGIASRVGTRRSRRRAFLRFVMPESALERIDPDQLADELAVLFGHDLADQPPVVMKQLSALRAYDATDRLAQLAGIPTLVMSGAHDPIAPPRFGRALSARIPGARYVEFDDASHGLPIQHADRVNALLEEHLGLADSRHDGRSTRTATRR